MVGPAPEASEVTVVALKCTNVHVEGFEKPQTFTPERMGVPSYARLQIPTRRPDATREILNVLEWLADQIRQLRRENIEQDWIYGSRLKTLIDAANLQLQPYTKSSTQK